MSDNITNICTRLWTPILPTVFSDTLSYMEQLSAFSKKLNELITSYNKFSGEYENYVKEQLAPYQSQLDNLDKRLNSVVTEINANFDAFKVDVNARVDAQNASIAQLRTDVNDKIDDYKADIYAKLSETEKEIYAHVESELLRLKTDLTTQVTIQLQFLRRLIDLHDANVKTWLEGRLSEFLSEIPRGQVIVTNPTNGALDSLQQTLFDMYDYYRTDGLTAQEYDNLQLTASEYDAQGLTAYEYDFYSTRTLQIDERFYMNDPFNGKFKLISRVVDELADLHKGDSAFTSEQYDALEMTAETYDGKELSAYSYDWQGRLLLSA